MQPDRLLSAAPLPVPPALEIAGIRFRPEAAGSPTLREDLPHYREFLGRPRSRRVWREVPVRLRPGGGRIPRDAPRLFAAEGSYEVWGERGRGVRWIRFHPPSLTRPLWTARLGPDEADVHCGPELVRRRGGARFLHDPCAYPLDQIMTAHYLSGRGLLVHAGGAAGAGRAVVFAGVSGAGKTTLAALLAGAGVDVLSDDRMIVRRDGGRFAACGTPWPGEGGYARNRTAALAAVVFLEKGPRAVLRRLAPGDAVRRLAPVVTVPWYDAEGVTASLGLCDDLLRRVPAFALAFAPKPGAAAVVERLLSR